MKRSQIVLFSIFIVLTGIIYLALSRNKKEDVKTVKEVNSTIYVPITKTTNKLQSMSIVSYGQITPNTELVVSFEVQGKLIQGGTNLKPGSKFSKGQILYRIDNTEAFYTLSARKASLTNLVLNAMPDIEMDYASEKNKWLNFIEDLNPGKMLPELPKMNSSKERMFITSKNILSEYFNLKSLESRMEKYFYAAPFSGTVVENFAEPGSIINPGSQIAKIAKTGDFEVKVPINVSDLEVFKQKSTASFTNSSGEQIGSGKIIRISDVINQQTQSIDVYYSIKPVNNKQIYHGIFVNVTINQEAIKETMSLPRTAVKNKKVIVLEGSKLVAHEIEIAGSRPDTLFVTGLKNGQKVVLEQLEEINSKYKYKGIVR